MNSASKRMLSLCLVLTMIFSLGAVNIAFAAYEVSGDSVILRAPQGHIVKTAYSLPGYTGDVAWSLDGAPADVEIKEDGGLLVKGEAASGTFDIVASDESGAELASKSVTIMDKLYSWADSYERAYVDFEEQTEDNAPSDRLVGTANWNDHVIRFKRANRTNDPLAVVKKEANGNKYISAIGTSSWYNNGASFLTDIISVSDDTKNAFINADITTIEANFMAESSMISSYNSGSTFWSLMTVVPSGSSDVALDLRYMPSGTNNIEIHSFTDSNGIGNQTLSQGLVATLPVDTWFNVRIEADILGGTYDLYINNEKLLINNKHTMPSLACSYYIGIGVDNFAAYTGSRLIPAIADKFPDTLYYTSSRQEAVVGLDTSVYLGSYPYEDKVSYTGGGVTVLGDKLFVPAGFGTVDIEASDSMFGMSKTISFAEDTGIELSFDGIDTGMESGTAVLSDGTLDTSAGSATFDLKDAKGNMLLTFDAFDAVSLSLVTTEGISPVSVTTAAPVGSHGELLLAASTLEGTYMVIFDGKVAAEGTLPSGGLHNVTINGAAIDNFVYSSMVSTKPYAFAPVVSGVTAVGQELEADYTYYSPWGANEASATVTWLASSTISGSYTQVGTGKTFTPDENTADKYLKYTVTVSDGTNTSASVTSEIVYINDTYTLALSGNTLTLTALNSLGGSDAYGVICLYLGNTLMETRLKKIEFTGPEYIWNEDITGFDGASAVLFYENNLKSVSSPKTVGTVPTVQTSDPQAEAGVYVKNNKLYISGTADTMAAVLIYGHETAQSDATVSYHGIYDRADVLATEGTQSAKDYLSYATSVLFDSHGRAVLNLPSLPGGSYTADVVFKDGTNTVCTFMVSPQNVMTTSAMDMPGFLDVLKLYSAKSDGDVETVYSYYTSLSLNAKNKVAKLLADSGYDIAMFDTAALLAAYFEKAVFDQSLYNLLKAELSSQSLDTKIVDIMKNDADPKATGTAILNSTWHGIDSLLDIAYEKALLYGVYHVKNYMEADSFLNVLTDTNYPSSNDKGGICNLVAGTLYNSLTELKNAINSYTPPSQGGGGSGGFGGATGGTTEITVPVPSAPQKTQVYTDVTADHWADESITYLSSLNIINGRPDGSFGPEAQITRAEFVKIITEAFDISGNEATGFDDVAKDAWYAPYVEKAASAGIVNGANGLFMPDSPITRQDASVILYRVLSSMDYGFDNDGIGFADKSDISDYALDAVISLQGVGLINGMEDGSFYPHNLMTRAQCAHIIANALRSF